MNLVSLPLSIVLFAIVYLLGIYGLLILAQILKENNTTIAQNPKETNNQVKIP